MPEAPRRPLVVSLEGAPAFARPPAPASAGRPIELRTQGYLLRSLVPQDVTPRFVDWLGDAQMLQGLNLARLDFTPDRLRAFVARFDNRSNFIVGIFDEANGLLVGFYTIDLNLAHRVGAITTGVGEKGYLGKGTLWATVDALLDEFFEHRNVDKMTARILAKNRRMLFNFINNTRFVFEARLRRECAAPDGSRVDLLLFAAFRNGRREDGTKP